MSEDILYEIHGWIVICWAGLIASVALLLLCVFYDDIFKNG